VSHGLAIAPVHLSDATSRLHNLVVLPDMPVYLLQRRSSSDLRNLGHSSLCSVIRCHVDDPQARPSSYFHHREGQMDHRDQCIEWDIPAELVALASVL
jgi:hypothetical protein